MEWTKGSLSVTTYNFYQQARPLHLVVFQIYSQSYTLLLKLLALQMCLPHSTNTTFLLIPFTATSDTWHTQVGASKYSIVQYRYKHIISTGVVGNYKNLFCYKQQYIKFSTSHYSIVILALALCLCRYTIYDLQLLLT